MSFDPPLPNFGSSDPVARFLNVSCLDLLLIELVPLAERTAYKALPLPTDQHQQSNNDISSDIPPDSSSSKSSKPIPPPNSTENHPPIPSSLTDLHATLTQTRLHALGHRIGISLTERFSASTPSSPRPLFTTPLDAIKFLCKDLWILLFKKQIDNLKTNHRGVYVLTDNMFRPLTRMSMTVRERGEAMTRAQAYLWFPCGLIRGVLESLGIEVTVQAESVELPQAVFQIKTVVVRS